MSLSRSDIERLVYEVLLRLNPADRHETTKQTKQKPLVIEERVVTTAQLNPISERSKVHVTTGAVITPAARDLASEKHITLIPLDGRESDMLDRALISVGTAAHRIALAIRGECGDARAWQYESVVEAASKAVSYLRAADEPARRCLLVTENVDVAVCLANRASHVRAVIARGAAQVREVLQEVAPNLLVLDPDDGKATTEWGRIYLESAFDRATARFRVSLGCKNRK